MTTFRNFEELLIFELQDLINAESQIIEALPIMEKEALSPDLKQAFRNHLQETRKQVTRLKKALHLLDEEPVEHRCKAIAGLIAEADEIIKKQDRSVLKDAALIGAAQRIEHYEIATYGTAVAHAKLLDLDEIADLLKETLDEEAAADRKLTKVAEGSFFSSGVNKRALTPHA